MNIFGQPFDSWVRYQITKRQEVLGSSTNISSKDLQYYHSKTPWIRLASRTPQRMMIFQLQNLKSLTAYPLIKPPSTKRKKKPWVIQMTSSDKS